MRMLHKHLEDGRHCKDDGTTLLFDSTQNRCWLRRTQQHDRSTTVIEGRGEDIQAPSVKEWRKDRRAISVPDSPTHLRIDGIPGNHAMREDRPFGNACSTRGIEDQCRFLAIRCLEWQGTLSQ